MHSMRNVPVALAILAGIVAAPAFSQAPPSFGSAQLDQLVARIALYPDPLLAQILAAATYPTIFPLPPSGRMSTITLPAGACQRHQRGPTALDPSVQALLPFSLRAGHDEFGHELDHPDRKRVPGPATGRDGHGAAAARHRATLRLPDEQTARSW